jgi:hypothetical protein
MDGHERWLSHVALLCPWRLPYDAIAHFLSCSNVVEIEGRWPWYSGAKGLTGTTSGELNAALTRQVRAS